MIVVYRRESDEETEEHMAAPTETSAFRSPYENATPPGCEGWRATSEIRGEQVIRGDGSTGLVTILDA